MRFICVDNSGICPLQRDHIYEGEYIQWGDERRIKVKKADSNSFTHPSYYTWRFKQIDAFVNKNIKIL